MLHNTLYIILFLCCCSLYSCKTSLDHHVIVGDNYSNHGDESSFSVVQTYFGTNRRLKYSNDIYFSNERDSLKYGRCLVSIPGSHDLGEIERPMLFGMDLASFENPYRHINVLEKEMMYGFEFSDIFIGSSKEDEILLFIHGYNATFEDAARRTAQLSYDIDFKGLPMFFSWPSKGGLAQYPHDSQNIEISEEHIYEFLKTLLTNFENHDINIIAHSMGTRGLAKALLKLKQTHPVKSKLVKKIILAAPDIDADYFRNVIAPELISGFNSITLYASSKDKALKLSKKFNGQPRAGESGKNITLYKGIETIDASRVKTGILSHSYFGNTPRLLSDIQQIILSGFDAEKRTLLKSSEKDGIKFWKFK